ncbi:MAG: endonuclease/exonuclease/phosphatase family protein [Candidatus Marinimicrobia bacterium]|nr:endonuclease/exonuclease/phosphatase family protein [Candidatus Neomarinimicrobiota bacterium]MCF7902082.1 endonuclease/exonuclease/phosphatase family protein [Candidatus Neomarinimicrobiota bacterium]
MWSVKIILLLAVSMLVWLGCAEPVPSRHSFSLPTVDREETLEVITWNLRFFPQNGVEEVNRVIMLLDSLNADVVCLQEIDQMSQLVRVANALPQYDLIQSIRTDFLMMGILYKPDLLVPLDTSELFPDESYTFAGRFPLQVKFARQMDSIAYHFTVINMHLKAKGEASSIQRRHDATTLLHEYLSDVITTTEDTNFVVVGDWNDDLSTSNGATSFTAFMNDTENFYFTTWDLAWAETDEEDSYPGWSSFLDHILISRALFDENETATTRTLKLDNYLSDYFSLVSDHRPVMFRFEPLPD